MRRIGLAPVTGSGRNLSSPPARPRIDHNHRKSRARFRVSARVFLGFALLTCHLPTSLRGTEPESTAEELVAKARRLQDSYREREALEVYLDALKKDSNDFTALCGASYLYGQIGKRLDSGETRQEYYRKALGLARKALTQRPEDPETHLVMAWALGGEALTSSGKERVRLAREVEQHVRAVLEQRPDDDRAWYILANLNYQFATAGFVEKTLARVFLGGLPENLSLDNAIAAYRQASDLSPEMILYHYELARALARKGSEEEARDELREALSLHPRFEDDATVLSECRELLQELG